MSKMSLAYYQDQLGKVDPHVTQLVFDITGAGAATAVPANSASLITYEAIASQSVIDEFLGTTNEFLVAAFDATSMGVDAFGCIVNMAGQVKQLAYVEVLCYSGAGGSTLVSRGFQPVATLTGSSLTTECALGASGNVAVRAILTGLDALTDGTIVVKLHWISK